MSVEHLFPYSKPGDFVMRRSVSVSGVEYTVVIIGNYSPYSTDIQDAWGVALVVDGQRPYLCGGYYEFMDAVNASRGAFGALLAVKHEAGDMEQAEDDVVEFVLTHSGLNNDYDDIYWQLRRKAGY